MLTNTLLARCSLLCDAPLTLLLFCMSAALGRKLLRRFALPGTDALERGVFAAALGVGVLSYLPFALFSVGLGKPLFVAATVLIAAALLLPDMLSMVRAAASQCAAGLRNLRNPPMHPVALVCLALLPLLLVTFLQACCPPTDADGLYYHLTAPKYALMAGRFQYLPTILQVQWPLGIEMLFGVGMAFNAHYAAGLVQFGLGLLVLLVAYALGKRLASPAVGVAAAGLTFQPIRGEMTWAYIDLGSTLYALTALYAFFLGWHILQKRNEASGEGWRGWWALSAVLAGFSATAKLSGILNVGLLAAMAFSALWFSSAKKDRAVALRAAVAYFGVGLLIALPWYLRSWILTGTPIYPYFGAFLPVRDWSPEWQARLNEYLQVLNTFHSRRLDAAQVKRLREEACFVVAAAGFAVCFWRGSRPARPLFVFLFASVFLQFATSGIYLRYLLYLFPLLFLLVFWLPRNQLNRWRFAPMVLAGLVALRLLGAPHLLATLRNEAATGRKSFAMAAGATSRDAYLAERLASYPILQWSNAHLPPEAVMALGVIDGYPSLLDCRAVVTTPWTQDALRYHSDAELRDGLRRLHVTHLLLHDEPPPTPQEFALLNRDSQVRATLERPRLLRIAAQCGTPAVTKNGYTLYALNLSP